MPRNVQFPQPASLFKSYAPDAAGGPAQAHLGGQQVQAAPNGQPRAALSPNYFERLGGRIARKFSDFCAKRGNLVRAWRAASGDDRVQKQRSVQFNVRHKRFSSCMQSMVTTLKSTNSNLADRDGTLKTLRNDMHLLHRDSPRPTEFTLLKTRLDVELSRLSDGGLKDFVDNITRVSAAVEKGGFPAF